MLYCKIVVLTSVLFVSSLLAGLAVPMLSQRMFALFQVQGNMIPTLFALGILLLLIAIFRWIQAVLELQLMRKSSKAMQIKMFQNVLYAQHRDTYRLEELSGKIAKTSESLAKYKTTFYSGVIMTICSSIFVLTYIFSVHYILLIIILCCCLLLLILLYRNKKRIADYSGRIATLENIIFAQQWEFIKNQEIAPYLNENILFSNYYKTNLNRKDQTVALNKNVFAFTYTKMFGTIVLITISALFGALLCVRGLMDVSALFGVLSAMPVVSTSIFSIPALIGYRYEIKGVESTLSDVLKAIPPIVRSDSYIKWDCASIKVENVCYKKIVCNASCNFISGLNVVTGSSGCGKSTFIRLLLGLLPLDEGMISYDSRKLDTELSFELRKHIFYCTDRPFLSKLCLRDFVLMGAENTEDFCKIVSLLQIQHLDNEEPLSIESLSAGEIQKVAIAKLFMCKKKIWICDEITSHLDERTERSVYVEIVKRIKEKGVLAIFISHRTVAIEFADKHYNFENGTLTEIKTELVKNA